MTINIKKAVVVYGSSGSGKTKRGKRLLKFYGKKTLIEEWKGEAKLKPSDLALTSLPPHLISNDYHKVDINKAKADLDLSKTRGKSS